MLFLEHFNSQNQECIKFVSKEDSSKILPKLISTDIKVIEMEKTLIRADKDFFVSIAKAMDFPSYFGMNWDALNDCLRDMSWAQAKGYVLFVYDAELFWQQAPYVAGKFVESWLFAASFWAKYNIPFHLVFVWGRSTP